MLDGSICLAEWHAAGAVRKREAVLRREAELDHVDAWRHLGAVLADQGRRREDEAAFRAAIDAGRPGAAEQAAHRLPKGRI